MLTRLSPLFPYLRRYRRRYVLGFLTLAVAQLVGVIIPLLIKAGIDGLSAHAAVRTLLYFAGLMLGVALVKAVFQFWMRWILIGISRDVEFDLTNDLNAVRNLVGPGIMYSATTVVVGIATVALMVHLDWRLTLLALTPLPVVSVLVKIFGQKIHDRFEQIQGLY